ncbi:MAG: transaldolase family protein, partial [Deltaproteobacteria bacterium]|nr:transaldolase family protein [Deltaproteobacteria bacterium]
MVKDGICKFGNDYAIGLRWLRHLGFEQVSTNPVLAARAYQDEPSLTALFRNGVKQHPDFKRWSANPSRYGDEITLYATLLALWDNLYVFRPIFFNLRETSGGGVVSFQLNPNIAHLVEESIRDVFTAFSLASENLSLYDQYLLAGYRMDGWKGRPNLVIKVAATTPAARTITRTINSFGFGSNITVDFSVSQEATLLIEEMEGMAEAIRKGIRPTQLYMTNMGGRLESHLREIKL